MIVHLYTILIILQNTLGHTLHVHVNDIYTTFILVHHQLDASRYIYTQQHDCILSVNAIGGLCMRALSLQHMCEYNSMLYVVHYIEQAAQLLAMLVALPPTGCGLK